MDAKNEVAVDYWHEFYADKHCTLCGKHGVIETRGVTTPAGIPVGRVNYCICPNGQALRAGVAALPTRL